MRTIAKILVIAICLSGAALAQNRLATTLAAEPRFETLWTVIERAELEPLFRGVGPVTLFAPTEEAFAAIDRGHMRVLLDETRAARAFVYRHIIEHDIILEPDGVLHANGSLNPIERVLYPPPLDEGAEPTDGSGS